MVRDGDGLAAGVGDERWDRKFGQVGGFFFESALEVDTGFVAGPLENAEAGANASDFFWIGKIADFENFIIEVIGDLGAGGGKGESTGVGIECGDFLRVLGEEFEALEARRAIEAAVAFDGDGGIAAGETGGINKGAAFESFAGGTGGDVEVVHGEEGAWGDFFGHVDEGGVVAEPKGIFGVHDKRLFAAGTDFVAGIVEEKEGASFVGVAVIGVDSDGKELDGDDAAIGRPGKGFDEIGERFIAKREFFTGEETAALAIGFEQEDSSRW